MTAGTDQPAVPPSAPAAPGPSTAPTTAPAPSLVPGADAWTWLLDPLADNGGPTLTRLPVAGSIAIDAAAGIGGCPATDQRGVPRPQGPACDAGAVELAATP